MQRFISSDELEASYGIPGFRISNHDDVWLALKNHEEGKETEKDKRTVFVFFIKISAMSLQKLYPRTPSHIFEQDELLSQILLKMTEYYLDKEKMYDRIFKYFATYKSLKLVFFSEKDTKPQKAKKEKINEKVMGYRRRFINHFLRKAIFLAKELLVPQITIERTEVSYDEWVEIASESILDQMKDMEDYYEKRKNKDGELVDRKIDRNTLIHPDKRKAEGGFPTSPQEQQVIYEESIYDYIKKTSQRKLEGKKISERIDEALARAKWRNDELFGDYPYKTVREFYMSDPVEFLMCTLLPTEQGMMADYTFKLFEVSDCMINSMFRIGI